jgi:hypothetical protein
MGTLCADSATAVKEVLCNNRTKWIDTWCAVCARSALQAARCGGGANEMGSNKDAVMDVACAAFASASGQKGA